VQRIGHIVLGGMWAVFGHTTTIGGGRQDAFWFEQAYYTLSSMSSAVSLCQAGGQVFPETSVIIATRSS
jgi:hypothetical protein